MAPLDSVEAPATEATNPPSRRAVRRVPPFELSS